MAGSVRREASASCDGTYEAEIEHLLDLGLDDLPRLWQEVYGEDPPAAFRRKLLARAIAFERQARRPGGLSPSLRRRLQGAANAAASGKPMRAPSKLRAGTRLIREWNGETHVVDVVDAGFLWRAAVWLHVRHRPGDYRGALLGPTVLRCARQSMTRRRLSCAIYTRIDRGGLESNGPAGPEPAMNS